jgi:hypothetical protein
MRASFLALLLLAALAPPVDAGRTLWVGPRPSWMTAEVSLPDGPVLGSLMAALAEAQSGDTIVLPAGDHGGGDLVVTTSVRILGYGRAELPQLHRQLVIRADDVVVDRVAFAASVPSAVLVDGASRVVISRCELRRAMEGVHVVGGSHVVLRDNLFERVNRAILFQDGSHHRAENNLIHHAAMYALEVAGSTDVVLDRNQIKRPDWTGIIVHSGARVTATGNAVLGGDVGFSLQTDGNLVQGNLVQSAGRGILVGVSPRGVDPASRHATAFLDSFDGTASVAPSDNRLIDNRIEGCHAEGILLRGAWDTHVDANRISGGLHGVVLMSDAAGNRLTRNAIDGSERAAVALIGSMGNELEDLPSVRLVDSPGNMLQRCGRVTEGAAGFDLPAPGAPPLDEDRVLLFGDLHTHSLLSDGCTTVDEILTYARDVRGMPFCALSDHGEVLSRQPDRWPALNADCVDNTIPGTFVAIPGYEVTWPVFWDGHYNVYFPHDQGSLHRAPYDDYMGLCPTESFTPARLLQNLREDGEGALVVRHHFGPTPEYWMDAPDDPDLVPLTEVCSVHGIFSGDRDLDTNGNDRRFEELSHNGNVRQGLQSGRVFGLVGSSDSHYGFPGDRGLVAVLSDGLDSASIFEALRARRTYGTTGAPIALGFTVNGEPMGSVLPLATGVSIVAEATGTDDILELALLRDGEVIARGGVVGNRARLEHTEPAPVPGRRYRVRVLQADGEAAWSSPVWFDPQPPVMADDARMLDRERMSLLMYAVTLRAWHKLGLGVLDGLSPQQALSDPSRAALMAELWEGWVRSAEELNALGEELGLTDRKLSGEVVDRWHLRWGGQLPQTVRQVNPILDIDGMAAQLGLERP